MDGSTLAAGKWKSHKLNTGLNRKVNLGRASHELIATGIHRISSDTIGFDHLQSGGTIHLWGI
eukprot:6271579-Amphidinium_carterae.1